VRQDQTQYQKVFLSLDQNDLGAQVLYLELETHYEEDLNLAPILALFLALVLFLACDLEMNFGDLNLASTLVLNLARPVVDLETHFEEDLNLASTLVLDLV